MFLPACQTPIDRKCHAGNERRVIAQEKGDGLGHFIGPGQSVQGILLFHGIPRRIGMVPELLLQLRPLLPAGAVLLRCPISASPKSFRASPWMIASKPLLFQKIAPSMMVACMT